MIKKRNQRRMIMILFIILSISLFLVWKCVDIGKLVSAGESFQYNVITFATAIAGFLFTGIGILISAISNERVQRLWNYHYLDNLRLSSIIGMLTSVVVIAIALALILFNIGEDLKPLILRVEIFAMIVSSILFIWSMVRLAQVVQKLKKE